MSDKLTWSDARALGAALYDLYPMENPILLEPTEIVRLVRELDAFEPVGQETVAAAQIEDIQMEWYAEYSAASC